MTSKSSGRLYSVVTKHWAKIATALVAVLGLIEVVLGGLTAGSRVGALITRASAVWGQAGGSGGFPACFSRVCVRARARTRIGVNREPSITLQTGWKRGLATGCALRWLAGGGRDA